MEVINWTPDSEKAGMTTGAYTEILRNTIAHRESYYAHLERQRSIIEAELKENKLRTRECMAEIMRLKNKLVCEHLVAQMKVD